MANTIYRPLDPDRKEIRLLCFLPQSSRSKDPLVCKIEHVSLSDSPAPHFNAISYTWGKNRRLKAIIVDGKQVQIPENAEIALRYLHHHTLWLKVAKRVYNKAHHRLVGSHYSHVWLDAICIDQRNTTERNQQVSMMGELYPRATFVLVWLGNTDGAIAKKAVSSIHRPVTDARRRTNNFAEFESRLEDIIQQGTAQKGVIDCLEYGRLPRLLNWRALAALYSSPWFARSWTVQEAALCSQTLCFLRRKSVSYDHVILAARWIAHFVPGIVANDSLRAKYWPCKDGIERAVMRYRLQLNPDNSTRRYNLSRVLCLSPYYKASDARDKVFSVLGLTDGQALQALPPDYSSDVRSLYIKATRLAIKMDRAVWVSQLALSLRPPKDCVYSTDDYPSWVARLDWELEPAGMTRTVTNPGILAP